MVNLSEFWGVLTAPFTEFVNFVQMWFNLTCDSGISPSIISMIGYVIIIVFFLISAFLASTISEMKGKGILIHFVLGLLIPYVYPAIILFLLPGFNYNESKEQLEEEKKSKGLSVKKYVNKGDCVDGNHLHDNNTDVVETQIYNQAYFAAITVDENGNPLGPFLIELDDGRALHAHKIINAMSGIVALDIIIKKENQTIRLPYNKIVSCNLM